jgi:vancomycin permeability regulator SanA
VKEKKMRRVFVTSLTMMFATATPVLAAEYWVSQDPQTKYCETVETMPDGKTQVMIGASSYSTKAAANAAKKAAKRSGECVSKPD